jgi:hypothetical protein
MSRRVLLAPLVLGILGCAAGSSGGDVPDAREVVAARDVPVDFVLLPDAVVLQSSESGGPDGLVPVNVVGGAVRDVGGATAQVTGASPLDLVAGTADAGPEAGPASSGCGPSAAQCAAGESCLDLDGTGTPSCVSVAHCSGVGALLLNNAADIESLLARLVASAGHLYLKVQARVWAGVPSCSLQTCEDGTSCCNSCFAPLTIGDIDLAIPLLGNGQRFGCTGTECDFPGCDQGADCRPTGTCLPLTPGLTYWIWGDVDLLDGQPQFQVDDYCPVT